MDNFTEQSTPTLAALTGPRPTSAAYAAVTSA